MTPHCKVYKKDHELSAPELGEDRELILLVREKLSMRKRLLSWALKNKNVDKEWLEIRK